MDSYEISYSYPLEKSVDRSGQLDTGNVLFDIFLKKIDSKNWYIGIRIKQYIKCLIIINCGKSLSFVVLI